MNTEETDIRCDGGFSCPASVHIEGCYTGDGHPDARPLTEADRPRDRLGGSPPSEPKEGT